MECIRAKAMSEKYKEYLIDESKYQGWAESISFPESKEEVCEILKYMGKQKIPVTIQGGKTGITGGSVPEGGHILNLSRMNRVTEYELRKDHTGTITVEPGMLLMELEKEVLKIFGREKLFWPVQPTEKSASIGGIAACGAKGPNAFAYGSSRDYILGVKLACADGQIREFKEETNRTELDHILGFEGAAGVFTEITLKLVPKPEDLWGICFFFEEEEKLGEFVDEVCGQEWKQEKAQLTALEFLDRKTIDIIQIRKPNMAKIKDLPDVEERFCGMVYLELEGETEQIEELAEGLMELAAEHESDPDDAWALSGESEVEKLRAFRHAAAESINLCVEENRKQCGKLTKLGTDYVHKNKGFSALLQEIRIQVQESGIEAVIFGHGGTNHLHVNLLPKTEEEYEKGCGLLRRWAQESADGKGVFPGEHGIGKLKKPILQNLLAEEYVQSYKKLKAEYDAENLINRGNIMDLEEA